MEHIERYTRVPMPMAQGMALIDVLDFRRFTGPNVADFTGQNRIVVWALPTWDDPSADGWSLYLMSPGALRAAREAGLSLEALGGVSRAELPPGRSLYIGDASDWEGS